MIITNAKTLKGKLVKVIMKIIKQLKATLNVKKKSMQLQLYNWFTLPVVRTCLKLTKIHTRTTHFTLLFSLPRQIWECKYLKKIYNISGLPKVNLKDSIEWFFWSWDASTSSQVSNCDRVVLEIYLDHKFYWTQESLNCELLAYEVLT